MPVSDAITYSRHALQRMRQRRISRDDVELVLRIGEGVPEDDGTWTYQLDRLAVVIVEREGAAHVVTVMRMRKHT
jgi:hypothetical protein